MNIKRSINLFILLMSVSAGVLCAQHKNVDSLQFLLEKHTTEDTSRFRLMQQLSHAYRIVDPDQGIKIGLEALEIAKQFDYLIGQADVCLSIGFNYEYNEDYHEAVKFHSQALEINKSLGRIPEVANNLFDMGFGYHRLDEYDLSLKYLHQALAICEAHELIVLSAKILRWLGLTHRQMGNYDSALKHLNRQRLIFEERQDQGGLVRNYNSVGIIYMREGKYAEALIEYTNAYELNLESDNKRGLSMNLINIGLIYKYQNDYDNALDYFNKGYALSQEIGNKNVMAVSLNNLSNIYSILGDIERSVEYGEKALVIDEEIGTRSAIAHSMGNLSLKYSRLGQYQKALEFAEQSVALAKEIDNTMEIGISLNNLAAIHHQMKNYTKAIANAREALSFCESAGVANDILTSNEQLYKSHYALGNYKKAFDYQEAFMTLKDSIYALDKSKEIAALSATHELSQKEKENEVLQLTNEVSEATISKQRNLIFGAAAMVVMLILFAGYVFRAWRLRRALSEKIRHLNSTQSRWFTNIAHELRTPLTLITGPAHHFLKRQGENLDESAREEIELIERNGNQLLRLVNEILDISKLESGELKLEAQHADISLLIRNVMASFQSGFQDKGIAGDLELPEHLYMKVDAKKVDTIITNLISNALKFTNQGGHVAVNVINEFGADYVEISVSDTGIGINPEALPRVFDRYYQVEGEAPGTGQGGSGIGLALSKELALMLNGELKVTSHVGEGSEFTLLLPAELVEEQVAIETKEESIQTNDFAGEEEELDLSFGTNCKPHVLLVEDNADMRRYIKRLVGTTYDITEAIDGQVALDLLTKASADGQFATTPDLIVSDIMMPRMDGLTLAHRLKIARKSEKIPFIFLTARASEQDKLEGLRIGVDDYITKPFKEEELLTRIHNLIVNAAHRRNANNEITNNTQTEDQMPISHLDHLMAQLQKEVNDHISDASLSVDTLAASVAMHKRTLTRFLKKEAGLTPGKFIRDIRLQRALQYFENRTFFTVQEVAFAVGFESPSSFTQTFEKRFGKKPSEFIN